MACVAGLAAFGARSAGAHPVGPWEPVADALPMAAPGTPPATGTLPEQACGITGRVDDVGHETGSLEDAKFKLVIARPADVAGDPNLPDEVQLAASTLFDYMASESGGRKSVRLDLGTSCGPRYVDIGTVRLPRTAGAYSSDEDCRGTGIQADLRELLPGFDGPRDVVAFLEGVNCGNIAGFGQLPRDDSHGPDNKSNAGGTLAVILLPAWHVVLHEMGHNLGAVQDSAPHSDHAGHCFDGQDLICYVSTAGAGAPFPPIPVFCPDTTPFDCGHDDYFSPGPPEGSYLATHWNVYDSSFLCPLAGCVPPVVPRWSISDARPAGFGPAAAGPTATVPRPVASVPRPAAHRRCACCKRPKKPRRRRPQRRRP
jgi:hypothetical protein